MKELFVQILNMSITASWLVIAIAVIRLVFKKAPKSMICFLWLFVAIRLIFPFSFESAFSLIPSTKSEINEIVNPQPNVSEISSSSQISIQDSSSSQNDVQIPIVSVPDAAEIEMNLMDILPWVWLAGIFCMAGYAAYSAHKIHKRVIASLEIEEGIWISDDLSSPFILGVLHPKIYLPSYLSETEKKYVLAHEKAHLKRLDHWWKPLGYVLLSIHWFNPVMWAAYLLLCSDIELACDEKVIKTLGEEYKQDYSNALLSCSVPRSMIIACPLAFGEVSVKQRVKSVLNYKKPAFWVLIAAMIVTLSVPVFFMSDPLSDEEVIEANTIHFLEKMGEFAKEYEKVQEQFDELYNERVQSTSDALSQNAVNQISDEVFEQTTGVFLDKVAREYSYMTDQQILNMYYNRMFAWPFNEEYTVEFDKVKTYENSWASIGYAVFEDAKWKFEFSWVEESSKLKVSGFSMRKVELTDEDREAYQENSIIEMKGQLMGWQDLGDEHILFFISAYGDMPQITADEKLVADIEIGDCLNVVYREFKSRDDSQVVEDCYLVSAEKLNVDKQTVVIDLISSNADQPDKVSMYFSAENPNNNVNADVSKDAVEAFEVGDVVEIAYETVKIEAMDSKSYDGYELVSIKKAGGYYEEGTVFSEFVGFEPVEVEIERPAFVIGNPSDYVVLKDSESIQSFVKEMDSLTVYKDFIEEQGAGGQRYIIRLKSDEGRTVEISTYTKIDVTYSTPTAYGFYELELGYHFTEDEIRDYGTIIESLFFQD